jgi:hypothetical protein
LGTCHARGLADFDGAGGDQELPFREVSIADNVASALVINSIGVSVEELLDFQVDCLLDHGSGGLANVGVKLAGILKRLLEADGGGWVWIEWLFRCNLVHGVSSCPALGG